MCRSQDIDANLLKLFKVLWEERSSTGAARRLNVSQSAVSQALRRLRDGLGDDLFVKVPKGLSPTPRAEELAKEILPVVDSMDLLLTRVMPFDLNETESTFNFAGTDYMESLVLPDLMARMQEFAPRSRLRSRPLEGYLPKEAMQQGLLDCTIAGYFKEIPLGFFQRTVHEDSFSGICRKGHPYLNSKQSVEDYCRYNHLLVSINGDFKGITDSNLPKGMARTVCMTSFSFLALPYVLQKTDTLLVLPKKLADKHKAQFDLDSFEPPIPTNKIIMKMVWHERVHKDPFQKWIRQQIAEICGQL